MIGAIGGINSVINKTTGVNPLGDGLGAVIGGIGSIFGNGRDAKRKKRQAYWDRLSGAGVRMSVIEKWHSDDHAAGQNLIQIINEGKQKGVNYINKNLRGQVTTSKTRDLLNEFRRWYQDNKTSGTSGLGGDNDTVETVGLSLSAVAGGLGVLYGFKKLFLD